MITSPHPAAREPGRVRRILLLTPQVPYPPEQGTALRNFHLLRGVASRHTVSLLTFDHGAAPAPLPPELTSLCAGCVTIPAPRSPRASRLRSLAVKGEPDLAVRLWSEQFAEALEAQLAATGAEILQVEGLELAPYALLVREHCGDSGPRIVLDDHNAEYLLQRRAFRADVGVPARWAAALYSLVQWRRLARFERRALLAADAVVAVSEADAAALRRLDARVRPLVVPNGVDVERYRPGLPDSLELRHPAVVFTGKMDYRPNVDAVLWLHRRVWPLVRRRVPEAHLYVVGKSPHPRLAPLRRDPSVTVTGYVVDDLPYFGGADVYVAPLRVGGGTRLKILQALAAGVPLVSTPLGAEGIPLRHGEHALLAAEAPAFASAIVEVLRDGDRARDMGLAGSAWVGEEYRWERILPRLLPLYEEL